MNNKQDVPDKPHPTHKIRSSDASTYDMVCIVCGATDITGSGWGQLRFECHEPR